MVGLGFLPGGNSSYAYGINADGSAVVGESDNNVLQTREAYRWTAATGMQSIEDVLSADGADLAGWILQSAQNVSADGSVITGSGADPSGKSEAWIAHIPVNAFAMLDLAGVDHSIGSLLWGGTVTNSGPDRTDCGKRQHQHDVQRDHPGLDQHNSVDQGRHGHADADRDQYVHWRHGHCCGHLELGNGASILGDVTFQNTVGTLKLDDSSSFSGTVMGMSGQDTIDFADIDPTKVQIPSYTGTATGGTLTVTDGSHSANIALLGNYLASSFVASSDGHGGTNVIDPPLSASTHPLNLAPSHA